MWKWFKLTDDSFAALRNANVPDTVLEKITLLKNKDLSQRDLAKEITKALDTIEMVLYQDLILNHAIELQGKALRLKRFNRCLIILRVIAISLFVSLCISAGLLHLKIISAILVFTFMILGFLSVVLDIQRNELLKKIKPGSEEDYSEEFSSLGHHPAKLKPALLLPFSLRTRILIYLGILAVDYVLMRTGVFNGFFDCFVLLASLFMIPMALFIKFPQYDPNATIDPDWQPKTKKDYYVPNIRTRACWAPFLLWLGFSSVVLGLMIYEGIACSGCLLELLGLIVLAIKWKRNCRASNRPATETPHDMDN
jgi:hypothetical protein